MFFLETNYSFLKYNNNFVFMTFSSEKVTFSSEKVTFSREKVTFSREKVVFRNEKMTFSALKVILLHINMRINMHSVIVDQRCAMCWQNRSFARLPEFVELLLDDGSQGTGCPSLSMVRILCAETLTVAMVATVSIHSVFRILMGFVFWLRSRHAGLFSAKMAMRSSSCWYWWSSMNEVQTRRPSWCEPVVTRQMAETP